MEEIQVTWKWAIKVWWSWAWRAAVWTLPTAFLLGFCLGIVLGVCSGQEKLATGL